MKMLETDREERLRALLELEGGNTLPPMDLTGKPDAYGPGTPPVRTLRLPTVDLSTPEARANFEANGYNTPQVAKLQQATAPASLPAGGDYGVPDAAAFARQRGAAPVAAPAPVDPYADAAESDRVANNRRVMEAAARQFISGISRTPQQDVLAQPGTAVASQKAAERQAKLDAIKALEMENEGKKWSYTRAKDDEERAWRKEEAARDNDRGERSLKASQENAAATRAMAAAALARTNEAAPFKAGSELRKEFDALPEVKSFKEASLAYEKIQGAAKDPSAAGDLSLIFAYMKVLDPGSTVREGEFANAQNATGIPEKVLNIYNKALTGERLNDEQRADFVKQAGGLYAAHRRNYEVAVKRYSSLAERQKVNPRDVAEPPETYQPPAARPIVRNPKTGERRYLNADGSIGEAVP